MNIQLKTIQIEAEKPDSKTNNYYVTEKELDEWFAYIKSLVPEEFKDSAKYEFEAQDYYYNIIVTYQRPFTEEELKEEKAKEDRKKAFEKECDIKKYNEIKQKWGL